MSSGFTHRGSETTVGFDQTTNLPAAPSNRVSTATEQEMLETMQQIQAQLKVIALYLHQLPTYLNAGLNFGASEEPEKLLNNLS